jgi:hypothetical protein
MQIFKQSAIDQPETFESKSKRSVDSTRDEQKRSSGINRLMSLLAGVLTFAAFAAPVQAVIVLPGTRVQLTWTSLGAGTSYYVQTSTNLVTWTSPTNTAATNVNLSYVESMRGFRVWASNAPPQTATLSWNPSVPASSVAGYYLYYGSASGNYTNRIDVGLNTTGIANNLPAGGTFYFVTTAYNSAGVESGYSNEAVWHCPLQLLIHQLP